MSGALSTEIALANIQSSFFEGYHKMTKPGGVGQPMGDPSPPKKKKSSTICLTIFSELGMD